MKTPRPRRHPLFVITNWRDRTHPEAGGAEEVCQRLAAGFAANGKEVVLLTAAVDGQPRHEVVDGYTIVPGGGRFGVYPHALFWILRHRSRIGGIIDSQNGIPFFTPLAARLTNPGADAAAPHPSGPVRPLLPRGGRGARKVAGADRVALVYRNRSIILVSPSTRNAARLRLGLKGETVVVPPGSHPTSPNVAADGRAREPRIVCVGRLVPHKGTDAIVAAVPELLAQFPDLTLHLVGDGTERRSVESLVSRLGLSESVVVHGRLGSSERDELLQTAWMSVNASEGEGWGLSVIEANAFGVPVLAYRRPGLKDSIRDGETGWLVDEGRPLAPAIATALHQLHDRHESEAMATRARQWASQFTWEEMVRRVGLELQAEGGRLERRRHDRRVSSDTATVVRIPSDLLPDGVVPSFRDTDKCMMSDGQLVVLLRGADTETAMDALERSGLPMEVAEDARVVVTVARQVDLVSPAVSASPVVRSDHEYHEDALAG